MSNILPLKIRPHLIAFLIREMKGEMKTYAGRKLKIFEIKKTSLVGRYILQHLEKCDYPVKDIQSFDFFVEIHASARTRYVSSGNFFKVERLGGSFVYLPAKYSEMVNDLFEQEFRSAFFNYVEARSEDNPLMVSQSIISFIDKYDLFEAGINQDSLRRLYYRMKENGLLAGLHGKLYR